MSASRTYVKHSRIRPLSATEKIFKSRKELTNKRVFFARNIESCQIFREKEVVIDDESYFRLSNADLSGNAGYYYYTSDSNKTPDSVKLNRVAKYEKLLVWVAISPSYMSKHYIVSSGQAASNVIFWPDLAKNTLPFLESENIEPSKCPGTDQSRISGLKPKK